MIQTEPERIIEYWKPRLGLHAWEITIREKPRHEQVCCAETYVQPQMERAEISVWRACDITVNDDPLELDILHELVHIRLWAIDPVEAEGTLHYCREAAIEWLARALFNAKHEGIEA